MAQGIQDYYNAIQKRGFQRNNLFRIIDITGDGILTKLRNELSFDGPLSNAYVESASVPSRSISVQNASFMGLQFNIPGTATYPGSEGWDVTFKLPGDLSIRNAFESMNFDVFDDATSTGCYGVPANTNILTMALLNIKGEAVRYYDLIGVWPVSFGALEFDLTSNGEIMTFTGTLAYQYFRVNNGKIPGGQVITDVASPQVFAPAIGAGNAC